MKIPNKAPCEKVDGLFIDFVLIFFFPFASPSARFAGACLRGRAPTGPPAAPSPGSSSRREGRNEKGNGKTGAAVPRDFLFLKG